MNKVVHRWVALVVGVALLVEVASGVLLLFAPEVYRAQHPELFRGTVVARPISQGRAVEVVRGRLPGFRVGTVTTVDGVYQVDDVGYAKQAYVDPGSGRFLGVGNNRGGVIGLARNVHDCALGCPGFPGYVAAMAAVVVPPRVTVGGIVLGVLGLALAWLCVSGAIAWWPGVRRLGRGLVVHLRRGSYRLNRDLHDVLGLVTVPFLLMWALTGAGYYLPFVAQAWYGVTGTTPTAVEDFQSTPAKGADITPARAAEAATRALPHPERYRLVSTHLPDSAQPTDYYTIGFTSGVDPERHAGTRYFAKTEVGVDRHSGKARIISGGPGAPAAEKLYVQWNYGVHFGTSVPLGWRMVWVLFGLAPLALTVTGLWTWLSRTRRRRRAAGRSAGL